MRTIATIEGEPITEQESGRVIFRGKAAVDTDGAGPHHGDPCAQSDTSLHFNGKPLNADEDIYIVVPPAIRDGVKGVVLGCQAYVFNLHNNRWTPAVVGDIGPRAKLGEVSVACAKALGINPSPVNGGEEAHIFRYELVPGVPAVVGAKRYELQRK